MLATNDQPQKLELLIGKCLRISWLKGDTTDIEFQQLREFCACAFCRKRGLVGKSLTETGNAGVSVTDIRLMGSTGVQFCFSDGHDRGIFPWGYLRAIADGRGLAHYNETSETHSCG